MTFLNWISSTVGTTALLGIVGFLARHWILERLAGAIKHTYDKDLATHTDTLRHKTELALKDFEIKAKEREIKFGGVFPSQREIIENTYERIYRLRVALEEFSASAFNTDPKSKGQVVTDAFKEFEIYYYPKAIYLPQSVVSQIGTLIRAAHNLTGHLKLLTDLTVGQQVAGASHEVTIKIQKLWADKPQLEREVGDCFNVVVNEFQRLLGISETSSPK